MVVEGCYGLAGPQLGLGDVVGGFLSSPFCPLRSSGSSASTPQLGGTELGPKTTGNVGGPLKVLAGGSFANDGGPGGGFGGLPSATAKLGAVTANAPITAKVLNMESTPQWDRFSSAPRRERLRFSSDRNA